jgi:hypothetical protein
MLKRLVYKYGVRVVSLVDGLDSERDGWELIAHIIAIVNEQYIKELSASVLRGPEGTLLSGIFGLRLSVRFFVGSGTGQ